MSLVMIIVLTCVLYVSVGGFVGSLYYNKSLERCLSSNRSYCNHDHDITAFCTGALWPLAVPFRTAFSLGDKREAEMKRQEKRRQELLEEEHNTMLAIQRAKQAEALNRELKAHGKL